MASLDEINGLIEAENKKKLAPLPDPKSFFQSAYNAPSAFVRGLYRSPADVLAMSDQMRGRANQPAVTNPDMSRAEEMDRLQIARSGIAAPSGYPERVAERMGRTAPLAAASGLGMATAVESPLALLRNSVIGDVVAAMSEQGAEDAGGGGGMQMAAGMVGGMVAPGSAADNFAEAASAGARRSAARAVLDEWGVPARRTLGGNRGPYRHPFSREVSDAATQEAERYARDLNISMGGMRRAASEAKRRMNLDPYGNEAGLVRGSDQIDQGLALFPDPNSRPLTDQFLSEDADVAAMSAQLDKVDHEFRTSAGGRRAVVRNDLENEFENLLPNGSSEGVYRIGTDIHSESRNAERALWQAVPSERIPSIDVRAAKAELAAIRRSPSNASGRFVPDELSELDSVGDSAPYLQVQELHSVLRGLLREADRSLPGSDLRRAASRIQPVANALRSSLEAIPENAGGAEFRAARDFTRARAALFDPQSSGYEFALGNYDGPKRARLLLNADNGREEAQRAVDILGRRPGGRDQASRVLIDELFDESLEQKSPRQILIQLRRKRDVYRTVWGDERYRLFENVVRKAEISRRRKTGTMGAVDSTGTGRAPIEILFGGAEAVTEPITAGKKVLNAIAKSVANDKERMAVLREGLYDPRLWQVLIQMPEPRGVAAWIQNWDRLVARARARSDVAARTGVRSSGSGRNENIRMSVDQPLPNANGGGVR